MTYEYRGITFNNIGFIEKGFLFRSSNQGKFEEKVLLSFLKNQKPIYYGIKEDDKKITFCSTLPYPVYFDEYGSKKVFNKLDNIKSLFIRYKNKQISYYELIKKTKEIANGPYTFFTDYPMTLKINAENYKDKLNVTNGGEGIIIEDDISLDDIDVLYSSNVNKSKEYKNKIIKKILLGNIENFERNFKGLLKISDIKKREVSLIYKYNKNKLWFKSLLEHIVQQEIDENELKKGISILKEKLNY